MNIKKRHHFVPKAYLRAFTDSGGRLLVYRKDEPNRPHPVAPDATAFERYYYSQPTPEGGVDHNRLEDMFSTMESAWPSIVDALHRSADVNDRLMEIFEFILLQRVRVPAARDATEARLAAMVRAEMLAMLASGQIPPPPQSLAERLDDVEVSIDPHQSIHGMVVDIRAAEQVFSSIGLCAFRNRTGIPFLTSDNPVVWLDPTVPPQLHKPYETRPGGPVRLVFPVSPTLVLVGDSEQKAQFATHGLLYGNVEDEDWVEIVNRDTCRYAYRAVYASEPRGDGLIAAFASESPVWRHDENGGGLVFAARTAKPKWVTQQQ